MYVPITRSLFLYTIVHTCVRRARSLPFRKKGLWSRKETIGHFCFPFCLSSFLRATPPMLTHPYSFAGQGHVKKKPKELCVFSRDRSVGKKCATSTGVISRFEWSPSRIYIKNMPFPPKQVSWAAGNVSVFGDTREARRKNSLSMGHSLL